MSRANASDRHGTVLVAALVCLLIVMGILGTMLQGTLRAQRQLHRERDRRQAELLLQAGSDRAVYRLAKSPDYRGETWDLPADTITDKGEGRVTIEVLSVVGQPTRKVQIMAEYPLGGETSIRRSRTLSVPDKKPLEQE